MKLIIASLLFFSIVILFIFALFPADISVSRVVQINKPDSLVRKKIADLREWESWNELMKGNTYRQPVSITHIPGSDSSHIRRAYINVDLIRVVTDTIFTRWSHNKKTFGSTFILTALNGQTVLEWTLHFHLKWYPWEKLASMFYDKQLGPVMEQSLMNLRREMEAY